jgi:hypothetical protein
VTSIERTLQGIDIRFHESARIEPERIVDIVGTGERIVFVPPTTLRIRTTSSRSDLFSTIGDLLREITQAF